MGYGINIYDGNNMGNALDETGRLKKVEPRFSDREDQYQNMSNRENTVNENRNISSYGREIGRREEIRLLEKELRLIEEIRHSKEKELQLVKKIKALKNK